MRRNDRLQYEHGNLVQYHSHFTEPRAKPLELLLAPHQA